MSSSLQPHGMYSPWNSLGQNTGVGCLSLLQGIFPTQGSNPGLLNCRRILYQVSYQGNSLKGRSYLYLRFLSLVYSTGFEALHRAVKRTEVKSKGEKERYTHWSAEFQRVARRDKKALLSDQCKEIEENNRMGKTRDLFKKIRDTKGTFHAKMGSIKDRNGMDLTEDIKKR